MNTNTVISKRTVKDYASNQEVRWCPGCGDYAILKAVQKTLATENADPANTVFVSGIGCSSRFPYYMSTYGFHTIHGRAPAIATGLKVFNPELNVWVVTGDGDGLSIGGNHMIHTLRRNVDLQILLFNNEIYGLTKGQCSPTSKQGIRTPSTPTGSIEETLTPGLLALGSGGKFIARALDTGGKNLAATLKRANDFKGTSFVEILQNCVIFNDKTFASFTNRDVIEDATINVTHGAPLLFGKEKNKGLRFNSSSLRLEVVSIGGNGVNEKDIQIHDETNPTLAQMLLSLKTPQFPSVFGVVYANPSMSYEIKAYEQVSVDSPENGHEELSQLYRSSPTWIV